jgi:hypothetical protein
MSDPGNTEAPKDERSIKSRLQEIQEMPVGEKIKLAMTGDKEARSILLKDSNKQVQEAVLASQRITDAEIIGIANSRTVGEEMLRKIVDNRQWMKNYQVRLALVNNPKTPLPIALKLVSSLLDADLKRLEKSKGIPNALVQAAKRLRRIKAKT